MQKNKKIDLSILIFGTIIIALALLFFRANFLISTILLFGAPSLYLSIRHKKAFKKTFVFALLFSMPITFMVDYLIVKDGGWYLINTLFSFRIFNIIVVEQFVWGFLWIFYVIIFYEYFFDKKQRKSIFSFFSKKEKAIEKRMEYFTMLMFILLLFFILLAIFSPTYLKINYSFFILSVIFVIVPALIFISKFPNFFARFFKVYLYFLFAALITEYIGLKLNHWVYPGTHYIGTANFLGFIIPYEEIMVYFILITPALLSYYEFFDDDRK